MIDEVKIHVQAGNGGKGCNSFKGKKFTRSYHPDGGSGGRGADIIIKVDRNVRSLEEFQFRQHFRGEDGKVGLPNKKKGADAPPCIIKVLPGTVVRDIENNLTLRDLTETDEELIAAKGGPGGKGNTKERAATAGSPGEKRYLRLELKIVADIGIVGYPNTGKSTLLARLTEAKPKVASYPFTTVSPFLGVLKSEDFTEPDILTLVEIPALMKGAHQGKGLGFKFLRHAQRTKLLIHLIDMAGQEGFKNYQDLNQELNLFDRELLLKPQLLVANKMDLAQANNNLAKFSAQLKKKVYPISALSGSGIGELIKGLRDYFR